jgi:competence protein ComEC
MKKCAILIVMLVGLQGCAINSAHLTSALLKPSVIEPVFYPNTDAVISPSPKTPTMLRISALPIGAGNCVLAEMPQDNLGITTVVINDCGSSGKGATGWDKDQAATFIKQTINLYQTPQGLQARVWILVSHADIDHYNILTKISPEVPNHVWLGGKLEDYSDEFQNWIGQFTTAKNGALRHDFAKSLYEVIEQRNGVIPYSITMLTVNASDATNDEKNTDSMMVEYRTATYSVITSGDATASTVLSALENKMAHQSTLQTDLLIAPHHGSITEGSNTFMISKAFLPKAVIFSAGDKYYHPLCSAVSSYLPNTTVAGYVSRIAPWSTHKIKCGQNNQYFDADIPVAIWGTALSGPLIFPLENQ